MLKREPKKVALEREEFERKQQAELERPKKVKKNKKEEDD
jgi:hypothetical protein